MLKNVAAARSRTERSHCSVYGLFSESVVAQIESITVSLLFPFTATIFDFYIGVSPTLSVGTPGSGGV